MFGKGEFSGLGAYYHTKALDGNWDKCVKSIQKGNFRRKAERGQEN
jgi:hypothetical protein